MIRGWPPTPSAATLGSLALVEALASSWGVHDHQAGRVVWFRLPLRPRRQ